MTRQQPQLIDYVTPQQVELIKFMESFGIAKLSGKAFVDGDLAVEVKEMTFGACFLSSLPAYCVLDWAAGSRRDGCHHSSTT